MSFFPVRNNVQTFASRFPLLATEILQPFCREQEKVNGALPVFEARVVKSFYEEIFFLEFVDQRKTS